MKPNKLFRFSEIMWLVITICCILTDLFIFIFKQDVRRGVFFLGMTFMAGLMYFVRKKMRKRADSAMEDQQQQAPPKNK
jgi:hypothetical protein